MHGVHITPTIVHISETQLWFYFSIFPHLTEINFWLQHCSQCAYELLLDGHGSRGSNAWMCMAVYGNYPSDGYAMNMLWIVVSAKMLSSAVLQASLYFHVHVAWIKQVLNTCIMTDYHNLPYWLLQLFGLLSKHALRQLASHLRTSCSVCYYLWFCHLVCKNRSSS